MFPGLPAAVSPPQAPEMHCSSGPERVSSWSAWPVLQEHSRGWDPVLATHGKVYNLNKKHRREFPFKGSGNADITSSLLFAIKMACFNVCVMLNMVSNFPVFQRLELWYYFNSA